jgi:hypothetical protein
MKSMKHIMILASAAAFLLGACTHKFDEYNSDPNRMPMWNIAPSSMLEQIIFSGAQGYMTRFRDLTGELMQFSASGLGTTAVHRYAITGNAATGTWDHSAEWAANADHLYKIALEQDDVNFQAIGLTLRALFMSNLTDIFGDIPSSEAFTIYDDEFILLMKFDAQKDIYTKIFDDLEQANLLYNASKAMDNPMMDLLYNGDIAKWRKFTNSLYLRLLMRLSNRDAEMKVSEKIAEIFADPGLYPIFSGQDDGAIIRYTGVTPFINTYGNTEVTSWNGRTAALYAIELLDGWADPRLSLYYTMRGEDWNGIAGGMPVQEIDNANLSVYRKATLGEFTSPYSLMRYDEVLFIKAEAAYRGWIPGGQPLVKELYNLAVPESIRYWDHQAGDFMEYLELSIEQYMERVPYNGTYELLMTQKFVAMFWNGFEVWHDYRRTGLPALTIGTDTQNDGILPRRFEYPIEIRKTNMENYDAVVTKYVSEYGSGDNMKTPVWWSLDAATNY